MSTEHLLGDIGLILDALIGVDNQRRHEAEARLNELIVHSPAPLLLLLAQVGAQGVGGFQVDQRLLALILLRRLAFREHPGVALNPDNPFPTAPCDVIPETVRTRIERVLGAGLEDEMDPRIRKGLGVCVGEWVKACERRQRPFPNLPEILLKLAASPRPFHRYSPFQILDAAPALLTEASLTGHQISAHKVTELLLGGIHDPSIDVRIEALKATRGVLHEGMTTEERTMYGPSLVEAAFDVIPTLPPQVLEHALEPLIDIASSFPDLFRTCLGVCVPFLLSCVAPPNTLSGHTFSPYAHREMEWTAWCDMANMAFEVLYSLVIADPATASTWENGRLIAEIVGSLTGRQVAAFAAEGESCQDWLDSEDLDDEDDSYPAYTEEMLERLAQILRDHNVVQAVAEQVSLLMPRPEWRSKYICLTSLASVSEGCFEVMEPEARSILELIAPAAVDPHPRVRYGFLFCIGRLCSTLEGVLQREFGDAVLDVCLRLLDDPVARVREAATAALVHFFEPSDVPKFEPRVKVILTQLINAYIASGPDYIKEQVLAAIATIATHSESAFLPYYKDVMSLCLQILGEPLINEVLVGRAMRCASLVGQAVGKEHFFKDAIPLCQSLLAIQNCIKSDEDKRKAYLADAWLVIAGTIGRDFSPFLQFVVPPVLRAASYVPPSNAKSIVEEDIPDEYQYDQSNSLEIQEKEEAFSQLAVYVHEMRETYAPWIIETMKVTLNAIHFQWSDGVRESACYLVAGLLQAAKDANIWIVDAGNLESVFRTLINAIPHEVEANGVGQLYQSIHDCLRVLETPLPETNMTHLSRATLEWLESLYERRLERSAEAEDKAQRGDYWLWAEAEQYEEAAEDEAMRCMDTVFGRAVKLSSGAALGNMAQIVNMAQKVKAAACSWSG